jgi:dTDP-4-amino-4,6-dideoxygalactose transaminase
MPEFHCGVEVQAALDAGLAVGFYRINRDLSVALEDLDEKLRACPGPVMLIHYFGFAQPEIETVARLCTDRASILIEDCAHGLFSSHMGRPLGAFGPMAVFSLRKTLSIYDGGALKARPALLDQFLPKRFVPPPAGNFAGHAYALCFKSAVRKMLGARITRVYHRLRWDAAGTVQPEGLDLKPRYADRFSEISARLAAHSVPESIVSDRRRNFQGLQSRLAGTPGYAPVFDRLPPDVCPLLLPIFVKNRSQLMENLRYHGVETFRFGATPHPMLGKEVFHLSSGLRREILCLPVHQQLEDRDLDRIADLLRPMLESIAPRALRPT